MEDRPAWTNYITELHKLHSSAGSPSSRRLAALVDGGDMSHTTVNDVIQGKRLAGWTTTERIVAALGGTPHTFRPFWETAVSEASPLVAPQGAPLWDLPEPPPLQPRAQRIDTAVLSELTTIRLLLERIVEGKLQP